MTSHKIPGRNCPACCPQKYGHSSNLVEFSDGQVPIDIPGLKETRNIQGPRRFSGRYWRRREFLEFENYKNFDRNLTQSWGGGPGNVMKFDMAATDFGSVGQIIETSMALLKNQWIIASGEVSAAIKYLRHLWLTTDGSYSKKALVVNRMICFYLILLGIFIAESGFWVNQQLLQGLYALVLKPKRNADMMMGFGAVSIFIFFVWLIGGPPSSPGICDNPG